MDNEKNDDDKMEDVSKVNEISSFSSSEMCFKTTSLSLAMLTV